MSSCGREHPRWAYGERQHGRLRTGAVPLQVSNLTTRYPGTGAAVLTNVSFAVTAGQRVALVGPNGAGKSTILKTIAGLLRPEYGEVRVYGDPIGTCHHRLAYLPQRADLDWRFPITVAELVMTGRYVHLGWFRWPRARDWQRVHGCLQRLGIADLANRQIADLSGGQQQRALLARALVQDARLFLLDEPLNAVDEATRDLVTEVLADEARAGGSVLAATHDLQRLGESFDAVIHLREGRVEQLETLVVAHAVPRPVRMIAAAVSNQRLGDRSCSG